MTGTTQSFGSTVFFSKNIDWLWDKHAKEAKRIKHKTFWSEEGSSIPHESVRMLVKILSLASRILSQNCLLVLEQQLQDLNDSVGIEVIELSVS